MRPIIAITASAICWILCAQPAAAAWPHDPYLNATVCKTQNSRQGSRCCSDGAGGIIITWMEIRTSTYDVFAQRISSTGVALWGNDGVLVCNAANNQTYPEIISDNSGGAVICWLDYRTVIANSDLYAQHLNSAGAALWPANGIAVCTAVNNQDSPAMAVDNSGGVTIGWHDLRNGVTGDIYAQRLLLANAGVSWAVNGIAVCVAANDQTLTGAATDGTGTYFVWIDYRATASVYVQRLNLSGSPLFTANGFQPTSLAATSNPVIAADGIGGVVIAWIDLRSGSGDIYAQRFDVNGQSWFGNGMPVCVATGDQSTPAIEGDGTGGAFIGWSDGRSGTGSQLYSQRISPAGAPMWTLDGIAYTTASGTRTAIQMTGDGAGGVIATWQDTRYGAFDVFAQRMSSTGTGLWAFGGTLVCGAFGSQLSPQSVSDGNGGAIIIWDDYRSPNNLKDVFVQRVERFGQLGSPEPSIVAVKDVPNDQGGFAKLSWTSSYLDVDPTYGVFDYRVWRSVPPNVAASRARIASVSSDPNRAAATSGILVGPYSALGYAWEFVGTTSAALLPAYSVLAPMAFDSVAAGNPRTAFMIEARNSTSVGGDHWYSAPDSGYSVDNIPPAAPAPLTGQYSAGVTRLHWNRNTEADLAGYRLYRGTSTSFKPGLANLVSALPDTGFTDAAAAPYIYKLTAVDAHGNESPVATLTPTGTLGVGDGAGPGLAFAAPSPNPARGSTTLEFTLPQSGHVRLSVFDAAGRRVQTLRDGEMAAGAHREAFALRDDAGRELAAGLYLVRLETAGRVLTRRLAAVR
jgi:hypothetical protein